VFVELFGRDLNRCGAQYDAPAQPQSNCEILARSGRIYSAEDFSNRASQK
jgi:hypothetical protein